jgi:hypothetical protein
LRDFNREEYPKEGVNFKEIEAIKLDPNLDENITDIN